MNRLVIFFTIFGIFIGGFFNIKAQNPASPVEIVSPYRANLKPTAETAKILQPFDEACIDTANLPDEQKSSRVLGVITLGEEGANESISIPATVQANKDFEITVTTSGNGCVSAADTGVILGEMSADVFVYDFTTANRPGIACTMIFKTLPHKATLRFTKTG